ncbi:hypothetical protein KP509_08G002700 [Ceratopteris richardii]|uniref:non-specific serine/threonine protein kinase n=1 Tax=Ceratopteris richardii TaxID=49495 RepID=A0A8T2U7J1_CERRI|nr:hypothetical protein KP509_08G002700 [Ceratopteris richardii]
MDRLSEPEGSRLGESSADRFSNGSSKSADEVFPSRQSCSYQQEICRDVLKKLREANCEAVHVIGFEDVLMAHFTRLPTRYALDVNIERAEDVLLHQRLLQQAEIPDNRPVFHVRAMRVFPSESAEEDKELSVSHYGTENNDFVVDSRSKGDSPHLQDHSACAPAFRTLDSAIIGDMPDSMDNESLTSRSKRASHPVYEITFSTVDKTKLLSQLSSLLGDLGFNIREAHAYSTSDGYSLDVFIVEGGPVEDTEDLRRTIGEAISKIGKEAWVKSSSSTSPIKHLYRGWESLAAIPSPLSEIGDDWELDGKVLRLEQKVGSGSYSDLYKGTYCGQVVAIKLLKHDNLTCEIEREFHQEVFIMRKVRHKNVVQFIGACTKSSQFCIVTEFMAGGSLHDYVHRRNRVVKLPMLLRAALDISKGMDYLHQNNIIHRDLKSANLLLDDNEVVKVADFGVARFQSQSGAMTAETGTYRWMAPEVISHLPYNHKVDIFSFGVVLWELLTGKLPYESMNPVQAAIAVRQVILTLTIA